MPTPPASDDPFDRLRTLVDDWERRIDGFANQVMGTDTFSRTMNQAQGLQLRIQRTVQDAMAAHLNNINMPSRDDVVRIGESLHTLERRMARVEELLTEVVRQQQGGSSAARIRTGPPRTRKPPGHSSGSDESSGSWS